MGSAVFNILVIIGATAVFAGQTLLLDPRPILRDVVFYTGAILSLVGIFADGEVTWWEGLICVIMYAVYILAMKYNIVYMDWCEKRFPRLTKGSHDDAKDKNITLPPAQVGKMRPSGAEEVMDMVAQVPGAAPHLRQGHRLYPQDEETTVQPPQSGQALARWHFVTQVLLTMIFLTSRVATARKMEQ